MKERMGESFDKWLVDAHGQGSRPRLEASEGALSPPLGSGKPVKETEQSIRENPTLRRVDRVKAVLKDNTPTAEKSQALFELYHQILADGEQNFEKTLTMFGTRNTEGTLMGTAAGMLDVEINKRLYEALQNNEQVKILDVQKIIFDVFDQLEKTSFQQEGVIGTLIKDEEFKKSYFDAKTENLNIAQEIRVAVDQLVRLHVLARGNDSRNLITDNIARPLNALTLVALSAQNKEAVLQFLPTWWNEVMMSLGPEGDPLLTKSKFRNFHVYREFSDNLQGVVDSKINTLEALGIDPRSSTEALTILGLFQQFKDSSIYNLRTHDEDGLVQRYQNDQGTSGEKKSLTKKIDMTIMVVRKNSKGNHVACKLSLPLRTSKLNSTDLARGIDDYFKNNNIKALDKLGVVHLNQDDAFYDIANPPESAEIFKGVDVIISDSLSEDSMNDMAHFGSNYLNTPVHVGLTNTADRNIASMFSFNHPSMNGKESVEFTDKVLAQMYLSQFSTQGITPKIEQVSWGNLNVAREGDLQNIPEHIPTEWHLRFKVSEDQIIQIEDKIKESVDLIKSPNNVHNIDIKLGIGEIVAIWRALVNPEMQSVLLLLLSKNTDETGRSGLGLVPYMFSNKVKELFGSYTQDTLLNNDEIRDDIKNFVNSLRVTTDMLRKAQDNAPISALMSLISKMNPFLGPKRLDDLSKTTTLSNRGLGNPLLESTDMISPLTATKKGKDVLATKLPDGLVPSDLWRNGWFGTCHSSETIGLDSNGKYTYSDGNKRIYGVNGASFSYDQDGKPQLIFDLRLMTRNLSNQLKQSGINSDLDISPADLQDTTKLENYIKEISKIDINGQLEQISQKFLNSSDNLGEELIRTAGFVHFCIQNLIQESINDKIKDGSKLRQGLLNMLNTTK